MITSRSFRRSTGNALTCGFTEDQIRAHVFTPSDLHVHSYGSSFHDRAHPVHQDRAHPCTCVHLTDLHVHTRAPLVHGPVSPVHHAPPSPRGAQDVHEPVQDQKVSTLGGSTPRRVRLHLQRRTTPAVSTGVRPTDRRRIAVGHFPARDTRKATKRAQRLQGPPAIAVSARAGGPR